MCVQDVLDSSGRSDMLVLLTSLVPNGALLGKNDGS